MFQDFVLSVLTNSLLKFFFPKNESSSQNREPKMLVKFQAVVSELLKSHPMWDVGVPYIYNIHRIQIKTKIMEYSTEYRIWKY